MQLTNKLGPARTSQLPHFEHRSLRSTCAICRDQFRRWQSSEISIGTMSALARFTHTVRDPNASREQKALALEYILHIVGDVHQPLHAGNGDDRGGNDVKVRWFGDETNLHSVWDSKLIDSRNLSYTEYARWLGRDIDPSETIAWWTAPPGSTDQSSS